MFVNIMTFTFVLNCTNLLIKHNFNRTNDIILWYENGKYIGKYSNGSVVYNHNLTLYTINESELYVARRINCSMYHCKLKQSTSIFTFKQYPWGDCNATMTVIPLNSSVHVQFVLFTMYVITGLLVCIIVYVALRKRAITHFVSEVKLLSDSDDNV